MAQLRWHRICFQEATSFPCFAMIGTGRVHRLLGTRRKVKIFRRKRSLHRTVLSLTREFAPSSPCFLNSLDSGKPWLDSEGLVLRPLENEEHNSVRWLAFQNRKRDDISHEKHTHRSRFSPAMPRTSFPDNLWKSPLLQCNFVLRPSKVRKLVRTNQFQVKSTKMGTGRKFITLQYVEYYQGKKKTLRNRHRSRPLFCSEKCMHFFFMRSEGSKMKKRTGREREKWMAARYRLVQVRQNFVDDVKRQIFVND